MLLGRFSRQFAGVIVFIYRMSSFLTMFGHVLSTILDNYRCFRLKKGKKRKRGKSKKEKKRKNSWDFFTFVDGCRQGLNLQNFRILQFSFFLFLSPQPTIEKAQQTSWTGVTTPAVPNFGRPCRFSSALPRVFLRVTHNSWAYSDDRKPRCYIELSIMGLGNLDVFG